MFILITHKYGSYPDKNVPNTQMICDSLVLADSSTEHVKETKVRTLDEGCYVFKFKKSLLMTDQPVNQPVSQSVQTWLCIIQTHRTLFKIYLRARSFERCQICKAEFGVHMCKMKYWCRFFFTQWKHHVAEMKNQNKLIQNTCKTVQIKMSFPS